MTTRRTLDVAPGLQIEVPVSPDQGLRLTALAIALAFDRAQVREVGNNWGPWVKEFLRRANVRTPAPWCAAFVNTCGELAGELLGYVSPLELVPLQAYVQSYYEWARKNDLLVSAEDALPGDLILLWYPSLNRHGHIGLVREVEGSKVYTVEGNTNAAGSREGNAVACKARNLDPSTKFVRWTRASVVRRAA